MKRYFCSKVFVVFVVISAMLPQPRLFAQSVPQKVDQLLENMTLEEKVGQMTQITIQAVSAQEGKVGQEHEIDPEKLRQAITQYHIGSFLNVWNKAYSVEHWQKLITQIQDIAVNETRLGIPVIYGIDAIHGANYTQNATLFPQSINMAATWNPKLVRLESEITAKELRYTGLPWNFNPVLGVGRHPAWPRFWETYGESELAATVMGAEYVIGQQGEDPAAADKVAACAKHYIGYSFPFTGKDRTPALIPERMLREIFLPPFQKSIETGALTVMVNSSEINGIPVHASPYYLIELLREELGFEGVIVTDWNDINNLYTREMVAANQKEAVRIGVEAGLDMSMVPYDYSFYNHLIDLVNEGTIPESRVDASVRRILKLKYEIGLFDDPYPVQTLENKFATEQSRQVNLQAARESITLLKNRDNVLPLEPDTKVLVTGPTANLLSSLNGGWTITWQGNEESLYPEEKLTILDAIRQKVGKRNTSYVQGAVFEQLVDLKGTLKAARQSDVIIACLGEPAYCETPGNINDLTLSEVQIELVEALAATNKPLILVLAEGRPRIINRIEGMADGIIWAGLPGMEGGIAIADVLYGDVNPSGKLPFSYPQYPNSLVKYDHKISEAPGGNDYGVQFPFGHGLSYTSFNYSNLQISSDVISPSDILDIEVTVTNNGSRAGKETILLYLRDVVASVTPPNRVLKRFTKVDLEPKESTTVSFQLTQTDLEFVGRDNRPTLEDGEFIVMIGELEQSFRLKQ